MRAPFALKQGTSLWKQYPTDEAVMKLFWYFVLHQAAGEWKMPPSLRPMQFAVMFDGKFVEHDHQTGLAHRNPETGATLTACHHVLVL
jgi:hypothetical protein